MAQQILRSSGWKFQSKGKSSMLINYTGAHNTDTLEPATIAKLTEQVRNLETEDLTNFLKVIPNVWQLIKSIPYSIPLLEAVYEKCEQIKTGDFPTRSLHCDELFCRLIWWIAFSEQDPHSAPVTHKSPSTVRELPKLKDLQASVHGIVRVLSRQCPELIERAHSDRRQLSVCLESLGCHGLVNSSSGLIRLNDAVQLEVQRHSERVKGASVRVKDLFDKGNSADPSNASHQRQMNLRLSEIFERLKHNENIEGVLDDAITSHHLSSLLRIVRKRVASDRLLIGLFNAFGRASPEEFSFEQLDPVVAKLIVVFNNAYDKILGMCLPPESDSGCSADTTSDMGSAPSPHGDFISNLHLSTLHDQSSRVSKESPTRSFKPILKQHNHHTSLSDLHSTASSCSPSKSLGNIAKSCSEEMRRLGQKKEIEDDGSSRYRASSSPSSSMGDNTLRLRLHINHLKSELGNARRQIDYLMHNNRNGDNRLWPEPDYPDATSYYNCSTTDDVKNLIGRFGGLYSRAHDSIVPTLNELAEFRGSAELQQKTILSVIVVSNF
ncbi:hypothetical protein PENTCL1PPCAC_28102, partial [Pristionchus entomophagus]